MIVLKFKIGVHIDVEEVGAIKLLEALQVADQIFNVIRCNAAEGFLLYKEDIRMDGLIVETYQVCRLRLINKILISDRVFTRVIYILYSISGISSIYVFTTLRHENETF